MQLPAYYEAVIGVAANNQQGQRSCFSNRGDIAAPGGNGGVDPQNGDNPCAPRTGNATVAPTPCDPANIGMCHYAIIGPSTLSTTTDYGAWSGTSFAAPIAAGVAAQGFHMLVGDQKAVIEDQNLIYCFLVAGAQTGAQPDSALGWGVINVEYSMAANIDPSTCQQLFPDPEPQ
jgi:hypothetical protein